MTTTVERLARVEERVKQLSDEVDGLKVDVRAMNQKLDDLLALRYKGAGAFWLASSLIGTGIVGALFSMFDWFRGS